MEKAFKTGDLTLNNYLKNLADDFVWLIIVENYFQSEPKITEQILDVIGTIGNFALPSLIQEQFFLKFLNYFYFYQFSICMVEGNEIIKYFFDTLHKHFKTHDFEEYELHYLDCVLKELQMLIKPDVYAVLHDA